MEIKYRYKGEKRWFYVDCYGTIIDAINKILELRRQGYDAYLA